jgi:hypothetical protein
VNDHALGVTVPDLAAPENPSQSTGDLEALAPSQSGRLLVDIDTDGRILPRADNRVSRPNKTKGRTAELLPTSAGWTVLRTLDTQPGAQGVFPDRKREIVVAGKIGDSGVSAIDFIGFLAQSYQTGVFSVSCGSIERSIYLHRGNVVWASSNEPNDRLGEFLFRRGKITREQLHLALTDDGKKIGQACVERGFISAHQLWAMVQAQLTEIFDKLIATEDGLWSFGRVDTQALAESKIHLSTQGLLVDALRRLDEMQVYRQKVRSSETVIQRTNLAINSEGPDTLPKLSPQDRADALKILRHVAPFVTIQELMHATGRGEFEVTRLAHHLLEAGLVETRNIRESGPIPRRVGSPTNKELDQVVGVYSVALKEMFEEIAAAERTSEFAHAVRAFLADDKSEYAKVLCHLSVSDTGAIDDKALSSSAGEIDGFSMALANDALSELLFFALFQATELLGQRRGDELARRVKLIHSMLSDGAQDNA